MEYAEHIAEYWYNQGISVCKHPAGFKGNDKCKTAIGYHHKALKINPNFDKAWLEKTLLFSSITISKVKSLKILDEFLDAHLDDKGNDKPINFDVLFSKAIALMTYGYSDKAYYEEAIKYFDRVLAIEPDNVSAWQEKGLCYGRMGERGSQDACMKRSFIEERILEKRYRGY